MALGFDWDNVRASEAYLRPMVVSETDTSNFANREATFKIAEDELKGPFAELINSGKRNKIDKNLAEFKMRRTDCLFDLNMMYYEKHIKLQGATEPK